MGKKNILIVGGGFAGTSALKHLAGKRKLGRDFKVTLIDCKDSFEFLPVLPDIIGGWLEPKNAIINLKEFSLKYGADFIKGQVKKIDFSAKKVFLGGNSIDYEYLALCSGAETNFFNNQGARASCLKLDTVGDALRINEKILEKAKNKKKVNIVIIGAGYTGIEIATNINYLLRNKANYKIYLLERSSDILGMVPDWMRREVKRELEVLGIEIICSDSLKEHRRETIFLESGKNIDDAICIWSAGVKAASFVESMDVEKERTRIKVKDNLKIENEGYQDVFVAGDAASFYDQKSKNNLRMAIMFAIGQGKIVARNILNSISGKPFQKYNPVDLGYIIPMAHGKAPGFVLSRRVHGRLGYFMHYFMCVYRSNRQNKIGIMKDLLFKAKKLRSK